MPKQLTKQEKLFVEAYVETGDGCESVRRAGYNSKNPAVYASQMLKKPKIVAELNRIRKPLEKALQIDREWVVARLVYEATEAEDANSASRVQALGKLSKILGLESSTLRHEGDINVNHNTVGAREAMLERLAALKQARDAASPRVH